MGPAGLENEEDYMAAGRAEEFLDNEANYLNWIQQNPRGFVLHTERLRNPYYMILHRATCPIISEYPTRARPGYFTERDFVKVCSLSPDALRAWVRSHGRPDGSFSSQCSGCTPGV